MTKYLITDIGMTEKMLAEEVTRRIGKPDKRVSQVSIHRIKTGITVDPGYSIGRAIESIYLERSGVDAA